MSDEKKMYVTEYPRWYSMMSHDGADALRRWCENYVIERYSFFMSPHEWITIEKQGAYYVAEIGADHTEKRRTVKMEGSAPPPPTFFQPAKEKYVPPPPPDPRIERIRREREMRMEMEYRAHYMMRDMMRSQFVAAASAPPPPPRYRLN